MSTFSERLQALSWSGGLLKFAAYIFCALGLLYLGQKAFFDDPFSLDFKYFWVAGETWMNGDNPYSSAFSDLGDVLFPNENRLQVWAYPPNWWPVSSFLSLFEYQTAVVIWRVSSGAMILAGAYFLRRSFIEQSIAIPNAWVAAFVGFAASMQSTAYSLNVGQTGVLIYFGACLLAYGMLAHRRAFVIAALILLLLKPHVGGLISLFLIVRPQYFKSVVIAGAVSLVFALPALFTGGVYETTVGFLTNVSAYSSADTNIPGVTFGLQSLVFWLANVDKVGFGYYLIIALLTLLISWRFRSSGAIANTAPDVDQSRREFSIALAMIAFVLPLHSYDLLFLLPILFFSIHFRLREVAVIGVAFLIMYRYLNLAELFVGSNAKGCLETPICSTTAASMGTVAQLMIIAVLAGPAIIGYFQNLIKVTQK